MKLDRKLNELDAFDYASPAGWCPCQGNCGFTCGGGCSGCSGSCWTSCTSQLTFG